MSTVLAPVGRLSEGVEEDILVGASPRSGAAPGSGRWPALSLQAEPAGPHGRRTGRGDLYLEVSFWEKVRPGATFCKRSVLDQNETKGQIWEIPKVTFW